VDRIVQHGNRVYKPPPGRFFLPLEFTVAAYRFGHSMVRDSYVFNLNSIPNGPTLLTALFGLTTFSGDLQNPGPSGPQHPTLPDRWIIEWNRFVDTADTKAANKARRIDTKLAGALFALPAIDG
jgi:hypothetical protein